MTIRSTTDRQSLFGGQMPGIGSRWGLRARLASAGVLYIGLFVVLALLAYWRTFGNWATFDDEGFFVYSLKTFLQGHSLYGSTYSEYGPFYYVVFGLFFKSTGIAVTEDAGRFLTILCWLGSSLCLGLTAHRFTKSLWIGLASAVTSYNLMATFPSGPMHAQILVVVLTALLGCSVLLGLTRYERAAPVLIGALITALALTKINLGGYALIATVFALSFAMPRRSLTAWIRAAAVILFACLGLVLMRDELGVVIERNYALCYALSVAALAIAAWPGSGWVAASGTARRTGWIVAGIVGCGVLTLGVALAMGTGLVAWVQETMITPMHQGKFLNGYLDVPNIQLIVGILALPLAFLARRVVRAGDSVRVLDQLVPGVTRLVIGLLILGAAGSVFVFKNQSYPYEVAWPFVWVIVIPPVGAERGFSARLMLAALAISQSLMAYPVAATQIALGDLLFVLCGAVALGDALVELRAGATGRLAGMSPGLVLGIVAVAALALLSYRSDVGTQLRPAQLTYASYSSPVRGYGAERIRMAEPWIGGVNSVISAVHREGCRTLMEIPGLYSFNLWTGVPTPSALTGEQPYWEVLSPAQQRVVLAAARAAPRLCLITDASGVAFYMGARPLPRNPLMDYLRSPAFVRVGSYFQWTVRVRERRTGVASRPEATADQHGRTRVLVSNSAGVGGVGKPSHTGQERN